MITLTQLEQEILKASRNTDYGDAVEEAVWVFAVILESKLDPKIARGVISSLVKKQLVCIDDYEGKGKQDDMVFSLTAKGIEEASKF